MCLKIAQKAFLTSIFIKGDSDKFVKLQFFSAKVPKVDEHAQR